MGFHKNDGFNSIKYGSKFVLISWKLVKTVKLKTKSAVQSHANSRGPPLCRPDVELKITQLAGWNSSISDKTYTVLASIQYSQCVLPSMVSAQLLLIGGKLH